MIAPQKIGLISDTHGLLRPEALSALAGSDLIVHAGDVGDPKILQQLSSIAPVTAVRGNIDKGDWAAQLPFRAVVETPFTLIYVLHDAAELDLDPVRAGFNIVVSGHSHKPGSKEKSGILYINPGSAGPRRFRLPVTVARVNLGERPWEVEFVQLIEGKHSDWTCPEPAT